MIFNLEHITGYNKSIRYMEYDCVVLFVCIDFGFTHRLSYPKTIAILRNIETMLDSLVLSRCLRRCDDVGQIKLFRYLRQRHISRGDVPVVPDVPVLKRFIFVGVKVIKLLME